MDTTPLFARALNLAHPWQVSSVRFLPAPDNPDSLELHIVLDYEKNSHFPCPTSGCGALCPVHDYAERTWRHLNFFQYKTFIHARLPRIKCRDHGVQTVDVSWARKGSGFTLLFEGWILELSGHMPISVLANMVDEHDTRLWRFIKSYTKAARSLEDYKNVRGVGVDETSRRGRNYITVGVSHDDGRVLFVTEGNDSAAIARFAEDFKEHGGNPANVDFVTSDMSAAFLKGVGEQFPKSLKIIDHFHVIKQANDAVDEVRREEVKSKGELKKTKYLWLSGDHRLSDEDIAWRASLLKKRLKTCRAYGMRVELQKIYAESRDRAEAESRLRKLCGWMMRSRLDRMKTLCGTLRSHWEEILNYFDHPRTNAVLEGVNSMIQWIKRRARGFRNLGYFETIIYLTCGKLNYDALLRTPSLMDSDRMPAATA